MKLGRAELAKDHARLFASADTTERAVAENFSLEENVSQTRQDDFENFSDNAELCSLADEYFVQSVQGNFRGHNSSTFDPKLNASALLPASLEQNQKIIRLERIDWVPAADSSLNFDRLSAALKPRDEVVLSAFTNLFLGRSGERPAFVAFKAELKDDLQQADWLDRIIRRLGLLHHFPVKVNEVYSFALFEYLAADVFRSAGQRGITQPFAIATVLECQRNPAFFPVPKGAAHGFTVDLTEPAPLPATVREVLHVRLDYSHRHVIRFGQWPGPKPVPGLVPARIRHLTRLCETTGRADFGAGIVARVP